MAKEISDADFKQEIEDFSGVAFVDFWASWCGPCRMMAPVFDKMAEKYPQIKFCKVNTENNINKAGELGITGIPCIIIFKDGKEVDRLVGLQPEPVFEAKIKEYLN